MAIYFIRCKNWLKIGFATNPASRFNQVQCHSPFEMTLVGVFEGGRDEERLLHKRFKGLRGRGEWFLVSGRLEEFVDRMTGSETDRALVAKEIKFARDFHTASRREEFLSQFLSDGVSGRPKGRILNHMITLEKANGAARED